MWSRAPGERSRRRRLRRIAAAGGIDAADAAVLDRLARRNGTRNPVRLIGDRELLAAVLARAVDTAERRADLPDPERQRRLARYYRLEERLERNAAGDPRRRQLRRQVERPCIVTPFVAAPGHLLGSPSRAPAPAPARRTMATILDVSTGGCAIWRLAPLQVDSMTRIEFDLGPEARVVATCRARHVRPQWPAGTVVHLQFTRLSRVHRNRIHRFVYGHDR
ncbi:MAG: PilZ domain-containing protein [Spirochaetaceae bacterium]|nr:PilZ domain-containing protein [Spirochaetaceae bacterium]